MDDHGEEKTLPIDVDLVDTSFLEANMHEGRHNGFINRSIVEDIRDIVTTGRRA